MKIRCVDGSTKTILSMASTLHERDGQVAGAVILIQDLTETGRIEEELAQRVTRLRSLGVEIEAPR